MVDGLIGLSGQSVEVYVDRVSRTEKGFVPTPDRRMVRENAMEMVEKLADATLEDDVLVCQASFYYFIWYFCQLKDTLQWLCW